MIRDRNPWWADDGRHGLDVNDWPEGWDRPTADECVEIEAWAAADRLAG